MEECKGCTAERTEMCIRDSVKLNPMFGAAAMSLSSVCVVCNALRLKLFKPQRLEQTLSLIHICSFEKQLTDDGMVIIKLFADVSKKEQKRRFDKQMCIRDRLYTYLW